MEFVFENEESEDEEVPEIDWSLLEDDESNEDDEEKEDIGPLVHNVLELEAKYGNISFEDDVPKAKTLTDPDVQNRARKGRQTRARKVENSSYEVKRAEGWSIYCSHPRHLPNLCEVEMTKGEIDECDCSCHGDRGYVYESKVDTDSLFAFVTD